MVDNFHERAGIFCKECGKPAEYYSFRSIDKEIAIQGYNCPNKDCSNDNIIEDYMTLATIYKHNFETKKVVIFRD